MSEVSAPPRHPRDRTAKEVEQLVLAVIRKAPGAVSTEIAEAVGLKQASIYKYLGNLQAEGLIRREGNTVASTWYPEEVAA